MSQRPLIIIPGLGDRVGRYRLIVPLWRHLGYDVHIFSFGWESQSEDFAETMKRFLAHLDDIQTTHVDIIGVSAGGTAAVNALALHPKISKVVTVASPYRYLPHLKNKKLETSIGTMGEALTSRRSTKILSMHGLYDQIVPVSASMPEGIQKAKVHTLTHSCIIATALTLYSGTIRRFLKDS